MLVIILVNIPPSIIEFLGGGPATSKQIQTATGLSQTAVLRQLRHMGDRIVKLPSGRTLNYALTCNAFGDDDKLPLYMVDPHGNNVAIYSSYTFVGAWWFL